MSIEVKIKQLEALPFVLRTVEIGSDRLTVLAVEPSLEDYETIDRIAGDTDVEVCPLVELGHEAFPLFIGEQNYHEWRGRDGELRSAGEAKMIQARFVLQNEPRTNILIGEEIGLLFGSVSDQIRFKERRDRK